MTFKLCAGDRLPAVHVFVVELPCKAALTNAAMHPVHSLCVRLQLWLDAAAHTVVLVTQTGS
jgi:hypothetical protein